MFQIRAKLIYNKKVKDRYFQLLLEAPRIAKQAGPGQFVSIKISDGCEPLLRRPFSIHRVAHKPQATSHKPKTRQASRPRDLIEILYEVLGKGTQILSQRKPGEYLDIIGPLGNGFNYPLSAIRYPLSVLVAGGMGVAPLLFLAEKMVTKPPSRQVTRKPVVLLGAETQSQILCEREFKDLGCDVKIATDDGSKGFKGKITSLLREFLRTTNDERRTTIYACGPRPMLKEIAKISQQYNIPAQVSLDEHMACGIGACLGCVVKTQYAQGNTPACRQAGQHGFQYKRVCKEGPVFAAGEIIW